MTKAVEVVYKVRKTESNINQRENLPKQTSRKKAPSTSGSPTPWWPEIIKLRVAVIRDARVQPENEFPRRRRPGAKVDFSGDKLSRDI